MSRSPPRSAGTVRSRVEPRDAAAAGARAVEHDLAGQPRRLHPQPLVGGDRQVGEHLQRCRGILAQRPFQRVLVELTDLRRHLVELLVPTGEIAAGRRCASDWCGLVRGGPLPAGPEFPRIVTAALRSGVGVVRARTARRRTPTRTARARCPRARASTTRPGAPVPTTPPARRPGRHASRSPARPRAAASAAAMRARSIAASHRRPDPHVVVLTRAADQVDDLPTPRVGHVGALPIDDPQLVGARTGSPSRCGRCGRTPRPRCAPCPPRRRGSSPRPSGIPARPPPGPVAARAARPRSSR